MSPHNHPPHTERLEVGVRELRDQLSRYVDEARRGHSTVVTVRGRPVARLVPLDAPDDPLEDLRRRGLITEPTRPARRMTGRKRVRAKGSVSDLVKEQRR